MRPAALILLSLLLSHMADVAIAFAPFQSLIPNGASVQRNGVNWPGVGHFNRFGGGASNAFGLAANATRFNWPTLCRLDSDGDGFTNGEELGDPDCIWSPSPAANSQGASSASFLRTYGISHPGFNDSVPTVLPSETAALLVALPGLAPLLSSPLVASSTFPALTFRLANGKDQPFCVALATLDYDCVVPVPSELVNGTEMSGPVNLTALPPSIRRLTAAGHRLGGSIDLRTLPTSMVLVNLSGNLLSGDLDFSALPKRMQVLDLSFNAFAGSLDISKLSVPNITVMLQGNYFSSLWPVSDFSLVPDTASIVLADRRSVVPAACQFFHCPNANTVAVSPASVPMKCGTRHPNLVLGTYVGTIISLAAGTSSPAACGTACPPNATVDWVSPTCSQHPLSSSFVSKATSTVSLRGDVKDYCDLGCAAAIALFVVGLLLIVCLVILFRIYCLGGDLTDDADREPIAEKRSRPGVDAATHGGAQETATTTKTTVVKTTTTRTSMVSDEEMAAV